MPRDEPETAVPLPAAPPLPSPVTPPAPSPVTPPPPASPVPSASLPAVGAAECRPAGLAAELRVLILRSARRLRAEHTSSITDGQYAVLAALHAAGPLTPGELAEREGVQPPSMTRTVAALADAGLVERAANPDDRRQVSVRLTDPGRAVVRETRRRRDAWLARRLAELTPAEREVVAQATAILTRIVAR